MKKIPAVAAVVVLVTAAFTGGMLVTGQDAVDPDVTTTTSSERDSTTAPPDPEVTTASDQGSTTTPSEQESAATSNQESREEKCYRLSETGTYAQWSVACEGVEPLSQDASKDEPVEDVGNPYGEDYDDSPQAVSGGTDDGSAAIVAEMRRQEQQRRNDEIFRQEHERQQAYTDQYNAQIPKSYDYGS